ncbi:MAG: cytochrome c biogenesis protein CcsA [Bacteroidota bacterium]
MKLLFSMSLTGALLLILAISIGTATFIENDFGQASAQAVVYKALWFELLLSLMVVNMIGVIIIHKLYRKKKWGNLLFHVAFIITLLGAAITRFFGQEGMIHLREGETATSFLTDETYISGVILVDDHKEEFSEKVLFAPIKRASFKEKYNVSGTTTSISLIKYIPKAQEIIETNKNEGKPIINLVTAGQNGGRDNNYLVEGEVVNLNQVVVGFNVDQPVTINFRYTDLGLFMESKVDLGLLSMDTREQGMFAKDSLAPAPFRHLVTVGNVSFVMGAFNPQGQLMLVSSSVENLADALILNVRNGQDEKEVVLRGGKGFEGKPAFANVGEVNIMVAYGSKRVEVPFGIKLRDFRLDRYPGSESPSSYASEVTVIDEDGEFPFRIYMNNILSHKGYRVYQSSYDKDELGSYLSINMDKTGTIVTYIGYLLLSMGLLFIIFNKNSRFTQLSSKIDGIHAKRAALSILLVLLLAGSSATAQHEEFVPTKEQADSLMKVIYQTNDGRMAPLHTLASDLLRKVYKKSEYEGRTSGQVFLGMMASPYQWQNKPIIQVKSEKIQGMIGVDGKYASYNSFFNETGNYKLRDGIAAAYEKKPAQRSQMDKDLINADEKVNISYMVYRGDLLKIFPVPNDPEFHWVSPSALNLYTLTGEDSSFVRNSLHHYVKSLVEGDNKFANQVLTGITDYQKRYGGEVMPSPTKRDLEIKFNELNIFERLFSFFTLAGLYLLVLSFIKIFRAKAKLKYPVLAGQVLLFLGFAIHTFGLILRWYISGHEPWSNGYESMIYIAWASLLAGFFFSRKSEMTLAVTAILSGIILWVAHLSWMDPQITNLVPVLKSYWLTIHVATITASYGFVGLGALLAFINLLSMIFKTHNNEVRLSLSIKELSYVIEMTLIFGLILLTIGNFLGGVWANESWGRYWGWDPKETWALASIIFYAFVLHMRFIPGIRGEYAFNLASLLAFASIIMTYFGVNYYLSGLHSYAAGDPVPIPNFVYYTIVIIAVVSIVAFFNNRRFVKESESD